MIAGREGNGGFRLLKLAAAIAISFGFSYLAMSNFSPDFIKRMERLMVGAKEEDKNTWVVCLYDEKGNLATGTFMGTAFRNGKHNSNYLAARTEARNYVEFYYWGRGQKNIGLYKKVAHPNDLICTENYLNNTGSSIRIVTVEGSGYMIDTGL